MAIHRTIRHTLTRNFYWIGNIGLELPRGHSPRHSLVIAEADEERAGLALETASLIEDCHAWQGSDMQFWNFSLLEDRETDTLEL